MFEFKINCLYSFYLIVFTYSLVFNLQFIKNAPLNFIYFENKGISHCAHNIYSNTYLLRNKIQLKCKLYL